VQFRIHVDPGGSGGRLTHVHAERICIPLAEEPGLVKRFGTEHLICKQNVPRWIPRLTPWSGGSQRQP